MYYNASYLTVLYLIVWTSHTLFSGCTTTLSSLLCVWFFHTFLPVALQWQLSFTVVSNWMAFLHNFFQLHYSVNYFSVLFLMLFLYMLNLHYKDRYSIRSTLQSLLYLIVWFPHTFLPAVLQWQLPFSAVSNKFLLPLICSDVL